MQGTGSPQLISNAQTARDDARVAVGGCSIDRKQPPLASEQRQIIDRFHDLYYTRWVKDGGDTVNLSWLGYLTWKCPLDLWIYQELLVRNRPDIVVETGTAAGGSALFMASVFDLLGHGSIVTIDIEAKQGRPEHPRITYITGSSIDPAIVEEAKAIVGNSRAMVILDSDHIESHVTAEIVAYSPLVQVGDYLVVEDTNINGHPTYKEYGPGPMEAVAKFLATSDEFEVDERCERFLMTLNPRGYLRRRGAAPADRGTS
jgi:cephalosporin hydroxylase